ncbi:MAG TPA: arylesterase [Dongiaceae bacterium]|nr:arylesterase [Dongiaceae bacterium]
MFPSLMPIRRRLAAMVLILGAAAPFILAVSGAAAADTKILALGDSLTAGYGLKQGEGFADQLQTAFRKMGRPVTVINGGVSGDTSAGGLARIDWALGDQPQVVIVELGANDMLRGVSPDSIRANLAAIIAKAKAAGAKVLLCGMKAQRNLGPDYVAQFDAIYPDLAKQEGVTLYPFFMDGIIQPDGTADRALLQGDGLHPTEAGAALIVQRILPVLLPLLGS